MTSNCVVTDGGRRWAARELRLRAGATERVGNLASIVTKITGVPSKDWRGQLGTLAEMIDRPVCHDANSGVGVFACSRCKRQGMLHECGHDIAGEPFAWVTQHGRYCPWCGAEITE